MLTSFRAVLSLKTGDRPKSVEFATRALRAFDSAPRDIILDLPLIDCGVQCMEMMRRQGYAS